MKIKITNFLLLVVLTCVTAFAQTQDVTFEKITLTDIGTISIPSIMELQSGLYKDFSNSFSKELGFDVSGVIIFQQKGRNSSLTKSSTYARVMINEKRGKVGEYNAINSKISLTSKQLKVLDESTKSEMEIQFADSKTGLKLIKWFGVTIEKLNGNNAIRTSYIRQLNDNPPVYVESYNIQNYDRIYTFTLSYRLEDAAIWADALTIVRESFKVTNIILPTKKKLKAKNR